MKNLEVCCVNISKRVLDGMRVIDSSSAGIALVLDDEKNLQGTLTDGDIRRALLQGASLEDGLESYMSKNIIVAGPEAGRAEILDVMHAHLLDQVPVVDSNGKLLGLHTLHELVGAVQRPNWAVIMAGGKGERLKPITETTPKPMLKVAGRPILERLVLHLVGFGIRHIFISINHLGEVIEEFFQDGSRHGCEIKYIREDQPMGTGGAISLLPSQPQYPLLVMNGDLVVQTDIAQMLQFHENGDNYATMGIRTYCHHVPFGCAVVEQGRITDLQEKPLLEKTINTGIYVLSVDAVRDVPQKYFEITSLFDQALVNGKPCGAFMIEGEWMDVGQHKELAMARGEGVSNS